MLDRLKSLPLTIILTVLIWMYAEAQFTAVQPDVKINVRVQSASPDQFDLQVYDPERRVPMGTMMNLVVSLQGPRNQIERIFQESNQLPLDEAYSGLTYVPSATEWAKAVAPDSNGTLTVNTIAILNRFDYFHSKGVTVTQATPSRMQIRLDPVVKLQKRVEFKSSLVDQFSLTPDVVEVRIPRAALEALGGQDQLKVVAEVADPSRGLDTLAPDTNHKVQVRFAVEHKGVRNEGIRVTPKEGTLDAHIVRQQQAMLQIPDVPVWLSGPPGLLGRYEVEIQPRVVTVSVAGTTVAIEALRSRLETGSIRSAGVLAYLDIPADDVPGTTMRRRVRFVLPEGLTQLNVPGEVSYRLVERVPATAPGAER